MFLAQAIAHRGLHDAGVADGACGLIENSRPAFAAAIEAGLAIECDVVPAADGTPMVFHDWTLDRLTAARGPVAAHLPAALGRIVLAGCRDGSTIPRLADVLALVAGRVPLFVEVKSDWCPASAPAVAAFVAAIAADVTAYDGPLAVMSFDPDLLAALGTALHTELGHTAAPAIPRGLAGRDYQRAPAGHVWPPALDDPARRRRLTDLADVERVGASFVAYDVTALPTTRTTTLRQNGVPVLAWTVRTPAERAVAAAHAEPVAMIAERPIVGVPRRAGARER